MNALAGPFGDRVLMADVRLVAEFEAELTASTRLAFRVAYSVLRHREDAEDVAQDVLAKAHARLGQLRNRSRLRAWLIRMTWRTALDKRESTLRRLARDAGAVPDAKPRSSEDLTIEAERRVRLWAVIDTLPDRLRIVVVLNAIEGHDLAEVAALLRIPEGTVKSRLFEARRQLRERLHDIRPC